MEQLPRVQRTCPRRAALRARCPRRRRPRGLRRISPDHRNRRARRIRPRAARHRNRALSSRRSRSGRSASSPQIDVDRSEVEQLTQQQRVISLETELAKQKIALARITGLPPNDAYDLTDEVPFAAAPALTLDDAIHQALDRRSDIKAAEAQVRAAQRALTAARDERLPSLSVNGNYGSIGTNPAQASATFSRRRHAQYSHLAGRPHRRRYQVKPQAALAQRQAELEDLKGQVESDVRNAFLDLQAATSQVKLAQRNLQVNKETLDLTRQRFDAGVTDNVEVVQAQESLTSADLDSINSVFAHNVAKLSLARAIASAADNLQQFLSLQ